MISQTYRSKPPVAWALAFTALVIAASILGGCSEPLAPMMPEWDVDANMPLVNHTYTMEDLLQEDDVLRISQNGDQVLLVTRRYPLSAISLSDHLRIADVDFSSSERFDALHFDIPDYLNRQLDVFTLFPTLPGGQQTVGSVRNDMGISMTIDTRKYFEEMRLRKGTLSLEFTNRVPLPLLIETIRLVDNAGTTLTSYKWDRLVQPDQNATVPAMALDGMTLRNNMRLAFDISSPGSDGRLVALSGTQNLIVEGAVSETEILSIKGYLPSQEMQYDRLIDVAGSSGLRVTDAHVRSGVMQLDVQNQFALGAQVTVILEDVRRDGSAVRSSGIVPAKGSKTFSIDLTGADMRLRNETDLAFRAEVVTEGATEHAVLVTNADGVTVNAKLEGVHLASMTGTLAPTAMNIHNMEYSDFGIGKAMSGSIKLSEARMWASLRNQALLPIGITDATVLGKNTTGSRAALPILPRNLAGNSEATITFENSQVVDFLNSFSPQYPDSLGLVGTFVLNPSAQQGSATADDLITGDLNVEFPLHFTQVNGTVIDTVPMFLDEDARDNLTEVNEGTLSFDVENHLPTAVTIEPEFLDSEGQLLLKPTAASGTSLRVGAAALDASGYTSSSRTEKVAMHFTAADFALLAQAASIRFRITFDASASGGASFRTTDYVRIRGFARLNISSAITEK